MGTRSRSGRTRTARRGGLTSLFSLLVLFAVAFGQAGLSANAGGLSLSMGQSKAGSGSSVGGSGSTDRTISAAGALTVNLDQYANTDAEWQNGDLNGNNSAYGEGMVVPFRLALEGLAAGQHTIHLNHDFLTGGSEAYDFLATWNVSENPDKCADPSSGGASSHCPNNLGSADTEQFPADGFIPAVSPGLTVNGAMTFAGIPRNLTMYGGTIDSIGAPAHASGKTDMLVTFTTTSDWAFLLWGAHIAQSAYWNEFNGGNANGAATISGAPWHMRTQNLDGSGNKNQDRSIQPSAITVENPDISVTKVADDAEIDAGDQAGFTITVTNNGPGDAEDVSLTDTLPAGVNWSFNQVSGGWTCGIAAGVLTCGGTGFTLAEGASASVHVFGTTDAQDCGVLSNTANVSASNEAADSDGNNSATATVTVDCPQIVITKTADDGTVSAGDTIGFTITATNNGDGTAHGVTVTDTLPTDAGLNWTIDAANSDAGCSIAAGVLTCNWGDLSSGASKSVHITSTTTSATCGTVDNTASVTTSNDGSDSDDASVTVTCPNVTVLKTADDDEIDAGDTAAFTIVVTNEGPGTAHDVTLTDTLPTGIVWSEDSPDCSIAAGVMTCDFGDLAQGATRTVHVTGETDAADCGVLSNTAVVAASNEALVSVGDNLSTATITVDCPSIQIVKGGPDLAHVGDTIPYTFDVTNTGDVDLHDVTLTDPICDAGTIQLVDDGDGDATLAVGETWQYTCTHVVTDTDPDPLPNTATVSGTDDNDTTVSDEDSHTVDLIHPAIEIVKTVDPVSGNPGDTVTYTFVVTNTGDTTLYDISVDDDVIGHIGDIAQLDAGDSATLTKDYVLPKGSTEVTNVGTATGTDTLGEQVSDDDPAFVTIVEAENPPTPPTAFTGSDAARLGLIAGLLGALGLLALALGRRRRQA
jgi:uncharacterized repeat protein (TIGR01451 family)